MSDDPLLDGASVVLSPDQAAYVRQLRVNEGHSFRGVARACFDKWFANKPPPEWWAEPQNQYIGTLLCLAAATEFGEDISSDPWQLGPDADEVSSEFSR